MFINSRFIDLIKQKVKKERMVNSDVNGGRFFFRLPREVDRMKVSGDLHDKDGPTMELTCPIRGFVDCAPACRGHNRENKLLDITILLKNSLGPTETQLR